MPERKKDNKFFVIAAAVALAIVGVVIALVLILGRGPKGLIGKWVVENGSWYYDFVNETEGNYGTDSFPNVAPQKFTYKDNGDSITIQYENITSSLTLKYRFEEDGKKLIVVDSFGADTVYVRQ